MKRVIPAVALLAALPLAAAAYVQDRSAAPAGGPVVVESKALPETIELTGVFQPAEVVEVKIDLESFNQDLKIQQLAEHGQQVKQGDVLLAIDPEPVERALAASASKKAVADVNLKKAMTDSDLAEQSDALARRQAQRKLQRAEEALSWFESVDGVAFLEQAEMLVQRSEDSVEDQTEELEQLQKMYQSEELTEDTADIVVKRAIRQLEYAKRMLELNRKRAEKMKQKDYADQRQDLVDALDAQRLASEQLENEQAQRRVQREAALLQAQEAARQATEEFEKLRADSEKLVFTAPSDGYVFYGQLKDGNWTGATPTAVNEGDEIKPDQVVMTLYRPGAMKIVLDLPEKDRFRLAEDTTAKVTPSALPETKIDAKVASVSPLAVAKGQGRVFEVTLDVPQADDRLAPGFSAKAELEVPGEARPMVPAGYVRDGKIRVQRNGQVETVDIKTGKQDGVMIQVLEGLDVGVTVLPPEEANAVEQPASSEEPGQEDAGAASESN